MVPIIANFELWASEKDGARILQLSTSEALPFIKEEPLVMIGSTQGYLIKGLLSGCCRFIPEAQDLDAYLQQAAQEETPLHLAQYTLSSLAAQWPLRLVSHAPTTRKKVPDALHQGPNG